MYFGGGGFSLWKIESSVSQRQQKGPLPLSVSPLDPLLAGRVPHIITISDLPLGISLEAKTIFHLLLSISKFPICITGIDLCFFTKPWGTCALI